MTKLYIEINYWTQLSDTDAMLAVGYTTSNLSVGEDIMIRTTRNINSTTLRQMYM